jgi:hypothetical protein
MKHAKSKASMKDAKVKLAWNMLSLKLAWKMLSSYMCFFTFSLLTERVTKDEIGRKESICKISKWHDRNQRSIFIFFTTMHYIAWSLINFRKWINRSISLLKKNSINFKRQETCKNWKQETDLIVVAEYKLYHRERIWLSSTLSCIKEEEEIAKPPAYQVINRCLSPVMGKHPDFMVAHPTSTIFRPLIEIFEISYFFAKNFEKV